MHIWAYTVMPGGNITKRTVEEKGPLVIWLLHSDQYNIQNCVKVFAHKVLGQTQRF